MPEPRRERRAAGRELDRRRQAAALLALGESTCAYAAAQLGNGIGPEAARAAAIETAGELAVLAGELRKLTRLRGPARRTEARRLAALGMSRREIAVRVGVSESCVWSYLHS